MTVVNDLQNYLQGLESQLGIARTAKPWQSEPALQEPADIKLAQEKLAACNTRPVIL